MENFEYILLPDLPHPPLDLDEITPVWAMINSNGTTQHDGGIYYQMNQIRDGVSRFCCKPASRYVNAALASWIKNNIISEYRAARINYYIPMADCCDSIGIHTDKLSSYQLLYNLDPGGPDAELVLWREPGFDLYRDAGITVDDPNQLEVYQRLRGPVNCWYLINSRILHSVEQISSPRINIQVGLRKDHLSGNSPLMRSLVYS